MASYKFTLRHPDGVDIFGTEYVSNWADISTSLTEHDVYKGVLREFSNTFEFNGYIRNRIVSMLDIYGYDVAIYLTIEKGNDNKEQWSFVQWSDELKADIQSIDIDELTCKLDFADNEFTAKLMARHDTKVNLDVTESIDGGNIGGLAYSDIKLHDRKLIFNSKLEYTDKIDSATPPPLGSDVPSIFAFPFNSVYRSDDNFKSIPFTISPKSDLSTSAFYLQSDSERDIDLKIAFKNTLETHTLLNASLDWKLELVKVSKDPINDELSYSTIYTFDKSIGNGGDKPKISNGAVFNFDFEYEGVVSLSLNDSLELGIFINTALFVDRSYLTTIAAEITAISNESNLDVTESIDGGNIGALAYSDIRLHDRKLIFNSLLEYSIKNDILNSYQISGNKFSIFAFPFDIKYRSDDNFKSIPFNCSLSKDLGTNSFYLLSEKERDLNISISVKNNIKFNMFVDGAAWKVELVKVYKDPVTENITYTVIQSFYKSLGYGGDMPNLQDDIYFEFDINFDGVITLSENESLQVGLYVPAAATISRVELNTIESIITCTSNESYPETQSKCLLPHEGFSRLVKILTGSSRFYSEFFGRKDLGYAADGAGAYLTVQNGRMIRNFQAADYHINTSLKEMFQSFDAVYCLCATIEKRDNKDVFRVEPYETFRNMKRVVKLGDFTNNISRSINPKRIFSEIVVGYKDQEYEELNGTFQFNGETNYSAPITTEGAKLDALCKYRADDIGIELTRRLQYADDPSKDYRADKDIFLIDAKPVNGILEAKKAENFNTVSGIYEPQLAYNLDITPARNLRRWGSYIRTGFIGIEDRRLKFVKGASNQALTTTKIGEDYTVIEGADVLISDLSNPIEYAENIKIAEAAISDQDFININENRGGLVEFESAGVKLFGRIAEAEFDANKKIANFELNRAYGI